MDGGSEGGGGGFCGVEKGEFSWDATSIVVPSGVAANKLKSNAL